MEASEISEKLMRHANNVRLAAQDGDNMIGSLHQVSEQDESMIEAKKAVMEREMLKKKCLEDAANFMEAVAGRVRKIEGDRYV